MTYIFRTATETAHRDCDTCDELAREAKYLHGEDPIRSSLTGLRKGDRYASFSTSGEDTQ